eukprot:7019653-Prymnesium_polylepis.2
MVRLIASATCRLNALSSVTTTLTSAVSFAGRLECTEACTADANAAGEVLVSSEWATTTSSLTITVSGDEGAGDTGGGDGEGRDGEGEGAEGAGGGGAGAGGGGEGRGGGGEGAGGGGDGRGGGGDGAGGGKAGEG